MQNNNVQYAGFLVRFMAYIVDCIIVGIAVVGMSIPKGIINMVLPNSFLKIHVLFSFTIWDIFMYLLTVVYFVGCTYFFSATLGKKIMKLKVVSAENEKLNIWSVIYRETIGRYLSSLICGLGYLVIAFDGQKRGIQDMLADTRVIYNFSDNIQYNNTAADESQNHDFVPQQTFIDQQDQAENNQDQDLPTDIK